MNYKLVITAEIHPTEDPVKVKKAISNLFSACSYQVTEMQGIQLLTATITHERGLEKFYTRLREERILTAARRWFRQHIHGSTITFYLHKQAAFSNRISFCESDGESPLGPIRIIVHCDKPQEFIDWLTPRTIHK